VLNKKILITGCKGFISSRLLKFLESRSYDVNCTSRNNKHSFYFDLKNYTDNILPEFDILIHLAYHKDFSNNIENKINIEGSKRLFNIAKKNNAKIIYISSQSASENSMSNYGRTKYSIENEAKKFNAFIIRPGLVYDEKYNFGIYKTIEKLVLKYPIIFVPSGLKKNIFLCNIDLLVNKIFEVINNKNQNTKIEVFEDKSYSLLNLVNIIANKNNKNPLVININYKFIFYALRCLEILNFKIGLRSDSIKSLL
tara:strand:+ start:5422 stop:6183 length:762 start_codon:yes stop_codon:yes gene_type:complete